MSSCSEGSRGLSVLPWVIRIFTNNTISPGLWLRQRPNRYAIRAGRNLAESCVFDKQSLGPFHCDHLSLKGASPITKDGTPSPEVTESLCRVP